MFIINWINLASLVTSSEANQLYTCSKMQKFAFDDNHQQKNLHCSLTIMSSSLLVLNNYNERVCVKNKNGNFFFRFLGIFRFSCL